VGDRVDCVIGLGREECCEGLSHDLGPARSARPELNGHGTLVYEHVQAVQHGASAGNGVLDLPGARRIWHRLADDHSGVKCRAFDRDASQGVGIQTDRSCVNDQVGFVRDPIGPFPFDFRLIYRVFQTWFKKGSGTVAGTARRVLRTTVPDRFLNHPVFQEQPDEFDNQFGMAHGHCFELGTITGFHRILFEVFSTLIPDSVLPGFGGVRSWQGMANSGTFPIMSCGRILHRMPGLMDWAG